MRSCTVSLSLATRVLGRGPRAGKMNTSAFLVGCMAGCLLSSVCYVCWNGLFVREQYNAQFSPETTAVSLQRVSTGLFSQRADRPLTLASKLGHKKRLLIVVLTSRHMVRKTVAIVKETWSAETGPMANHSIFVAGKGPSIPNVYWLQGMHDFKKGEGNLWQIFHVLKYLHSNFVRHYHWYMLVSESTYIAVGDLQEMLAGLDASQLVYMGRFASENQKVMAKLHLLPNEYFCEWGPGIILSNEALIAVSSHLDGCKHHSMAFLSHSDHQRADVELGRCFSRRVGIQCTSSHETHSYFVHDQDGLSLSPERLWYSEQFQNLLTLYPVVNDRHMRAIHHFIQVRNLLQLRKKLAVAENETNRFCKRVSPDFAPPITEPTVRSCQLQAFNVCNISPTETILVSQRLPREFKVTNHYELNPWMYLSPKVLYHSTTIMPILNADGEFKEEIHFIVKKAISAINIREASEWVLWRFIGGYVRYSGTRGREYLLDMILVGKTGKHKRRRLKILRPHVPDIILQDDAGEEALEKRVNILIPLSKVGDRFPEFLHIYEQEVLKKKKNAALILIVYGPEVHSINKTLERYQAQYPTAKFVVIPSKGKFTRGVALDTGMSVLEDSDLAFFCDIDMTFNSTFLDNCRLNTVQGQRVYYPIVFKYYDMNYVYRFGRKPAHIPITRSHGHWGSYSYGMLCIYKSDYIRSGGFDATISGWGGEDVDLVERLLSVGIEIFRVPERSLSHRYHEKTCSVSLSPNQFAMCVSSRNEGLADKRQLAEYVYYLEDKYGIKDGPLWT